MKKYLLFLSILLASNVNADDTFIRLCKLMSDTNEVKRIGKIDIVITNKNNKAISITNQFNQSVQLDNKVDDIKPIKFKVLLTPEEYVEKKENKKICDKVILPVPLFAPVVLKNKYDNDRIERIIEKDDWKQLKRPKRLTGKRSEWKHFCKF